MPFSPRQIEQSPFLLYSMSNANQVANVAATITNIARFRVPVGCTIDRMDAVYETEAGTTPALTVTLRTGTTALFIAACTADGTMVSATSAESGQTADRDAGEELLIAFTSANADNDFTGINIQVWATLRDAG